MAVAVIMPRQGQTVESCILTEWYKNAGDPVSRGDLLFAYETDKASFEESAQAEGILLVRFFEEGDEVPVLVNVAVIGSEEEEFNAFRPDKVSAQAKIEAKENPENIDIGKEKGLAAVIHPPAGGQLKTGISPRARKLAKEKRVALDGIKGTGPEGRVIERDIMAEIKDGKRLTPLAQKKLKVGGLAVPGKGISPFGRIYSGDLVETRQDSWPQSAGGALEGYVDLPLSNVRKITAAAMYRSLQNSAQLTHHLSANASNIMQIREKVKNMLEKGYRYNITVNDMVCFAAIRALKSYPGANAHFLDDRIRQFSKVNLGIAVDTDRGLLVPSLLNADELSMPELSARLNSLAEASRSGNVSPDLLVPEAASFTVSNLGNYGVEMFTPVINLPQVAILGVNTMIQRPVTLEDGSLGLQPFIGLSLTYDHRAIDGGPATRFLAEIKNQVEQLSINLIS